MRKITVLCLISVLTSTFFTGCSNQRLVSSSMLRTVGLGENAMPLDKGSFAIEFFNDKTSTVDVITEFSYLDEDIHDNENNEYITTIIGSEISEFSRYYGFNARLGLIKNTEIKIGFCEGEIDNGYKLYSETVGPNQYIWKNNTLSTYFRGPQFSVKHLITDYNSPHRLSLYLAAKYLTFRSSGEARKYDGTNLEIKYALIYGILKDPTRRSFPSLALYYNYANTKRKQTINNILAEKQPQAIGVEANFNIDFGLVYTNISTGLEQELVNKVREDVIAYFGIKLGIHFQQH